MKDMCTTFYKNVDILFWKLLPHFSFLQHLVPGWLIPREPVSFACRKYEGHRKLDKIKDKNSVNMAAYVYILTALCLIYKSEYKNIANKCIYVT